MEDDDFIDEELPCGEEVLSDPSVEEADKIFEEMDLDDYEKINPVQLSVIDNPDDDYFADLSWL